MGLWAKFKNYTPHLLMTLYFLGLAVFIVFLQSIVSDGGVSALVFVFYEHLLATFLLSTLAFFCERGNRLPITRNVFLWAFLLGFLQISLCQSLLTSSLGYVSATFQTTVLNTGSAITFVFAIIFRREALGFCTITGQAKVWGIILSVIGGTTIVLWSGPRLRTLSSSLLDTADTSDRAIGGAMVMGSLLAGVFASFLVEHVTIKYPAEISLSAMMCFCGTVQMAIITGLTERNVSAWKIDIHGSYELLVIIYGGTVVSGLGFYVQTLCIHERGPVFTSAFAPLLIVFSFVLETLVLRKDAHLGSVLGSLLVIVGLYLLLWGKASDKDKLSQKDSLAGTYDQLS